MSSKNTGINKKVVIIGCIIEVVLIAVILFSVFYEDPTYKSYLSKGKEQLNNKQYEKAIESFEKALDINPSGVEAIVGQADGYVGMKKYDQALFKLEEAKNITNNDPSIYNKLITTCVKSEDIEKANQVIMEIVQIELPTDEITSVQPAPTITPNSGSFKKVTTVTIDGNNETVYYTTNGQIPTSADNKYKKPLKLDKSKKYKIMALVIQDNGLIGFPATNEYTLTIEPKVNKPKFDKYLGTWTDGETTLSITHVDGDKIKFNISLSWVDEVIKTSSSGTVENGILQFSYTDNWENKGNGVMRFDEKSITLKMKETKTADTLTPGFGSYDAVLYK